MAKSLLDGFKLAGLEAKHPYLKLIEKTFNAQLKAKKQKVENIEIKKVKRLVGVSVVPINLSFSGQQIITLLLRGDGDVFRVQLNGKDYPLTGDLNPDYLETFKAAIKELSLAIIKGQDKFTRKLEKASTSLLEPKASTGRSAPKNVAQQITANVDLETQLDNEIIKQTGIRDSLAQQVQDKKVALGKLVVADTSIQ